jgi:iron complex transport system ATP-binding protein
MKLEIADLSLSYGSKAVLDRLNMQAEPGITALIGPNAAGKSTLLKCVAGILKPEGHILLDGEEVLGQKNEEIVEMISYLPQDMPELTTLTVLEVVLLGKVNSLSWKVSEEEIDQAYGVLENLGMEGLAPNPMTELSGGQQQMVYIAQSLVRDPSLLLMDEPTNNLDLQKQLEMFELVRGVTEEGKITTLMVLHDINLASKYADRIVVLRDGKVFCSGTALEVISEELIRDVYGVKSTVHLSQEGFPQVQPLRSVRSLPWQKRGGRMLESSDLSNSRGEAR